jgi:hypothetical protein
MIEEIDSIKLELLEKCEEFSFSQSKQLSKKHKNRNDNGKHLNDDSKNTEKKMKKAILRTHEYASDKFKMYGTIMYEKTISLYDLKSCFYEKYKKEGYEFPQQDAKRSYFQPDGGILFLNKYNGEKIPLLIAEDKVQGTNDIRYEEGLNRQSTGNAVERGAKNMKMAEMLFDSCNHYSYALFSSGCDFHKSETIAMRLEGMNWGIPNHYIDVEENNIDENIDFIIKKINVKKRFGGKCLANIFIKSHKWDKMKHGSSNWTEDEYFKIMKCMIDKVYDEIIS